MADHARDRRWAVLLGQCAESALGHIHLPGAGKRRCARTGQRTSRPIIGVLNDDIANRRTHHLRVVEQHLAIRTQRVTLFHIDRGAADIDFRFHHDRIAVPRRIRRHIRATLRIDARRSIQLERQLQRPLAPARLVHATHLHRRFATGNRPRRRVGNHLLRQRSEIRLGFIQCPSAGKVSFLGEAQSLRQRHRKNNPFDHMF